MRLLATLLLVQGCVGAAIDPGDPARIDAWPLDPPDWRSARGIAPLSTQGAAVAAGLDQAALQLGTSPGATGLEYPVLGPGFTQACRFDQGTLRFLYRPDWATARGGPGRDIVLMELVAMDPGPRGFRWQVNAQGTKLDWVQFDGEEESLITQGGIQWSADTWVVITAIYGGPEGATLYTNGVPTRIQGAASRKPSLANPPSLSPVRLRIGAGAQGRRAASGSLDAVELYTHPLSPLLIETELGTSLWAETLEDPLAVRLRWRASPGLSFRVRRRPADTAQWTVLATNVTPWGFTDAQVTRGRRYDYVVEAESVGTRYPKRYLPAGVEIGPVHSRGRALLLVDETLAAGLEASLAVLRRDLIAEGWQPVQALTPRHVDTAWSNNPPLIAQVERRVAAEASRAGPPLRALYLIGHVPVPHSGFLQPDGHARRPFPVDGYYGDVERGTNDWTDVRDYSPGPLPLGGGPAAVPNKPGDGLFDPNSYPSPLEVCVGRVDFANLPTFSQQPPDGVRPVSELVLLRRYLDKAHRYRRGVLSFPPRVAVYRAPPPIYEPFMAVQSPLRNLGAWFGDAPWRLEGLDPFREGRTRGYLLAGVSGYGAYNRVGRDASGRWTTADLAHPDREPSVAFYFLDGSYLGDWNLAARPIPDTLLRAVLAPPNSGLAAVWHRLHTTSVLLQALGLGDPLGEAWWSMLRYDELDNGLGHVVGNVHLSLLGDPTLHIQGLAPPQELSASRENGAVVLHWAAPWDPLTRYHVYRAPGRGETPPVLLTGAALESTTYSDPEPLSTEAVYLVRPVRLTRTGCGSYYNLGPGSFVEVR